eukprot:jgi/Botrbrau1/17380/Bobra.0491s0001.1
MAWRGALGVYVVAATNRPDIIDPALLRPGRLDKALYVPLPGAEARAQILRTLARKTPLAADVDLGALAADPRTDGFSGADLGALLREAAVAVLKESMLLESQDVTVEVQQTHFEAALLRVSPSVSRKDRRVYDTLRTRLKTARPTLQAPGVAPVGPAGGDQAFGSVSHGRAEGNGDDLADMEASGIEPPIEEPMVE